MPDDSTLERVYDDRAYTEELAQLQLVYGDTPYNLMKSMVEQSTMANIRPELKRVHNPRFPSFFDDYSWVNKHRQVLVGYQFVPRTRKSLFLVCRIGDLVSLLEGTFLVTSMLSGQCNETTIATFSEWLTEFCDAESLSRQD